MSPLSTVSLALGSAGRPAFVLAHGPPPFYFAIALLLVFLLGAVGGWIGSLILKALGLTSMSVRSFMLLGGLAGPLAVWMTMSMIGAIKELIPFPSGRKEVADALMVVSFTAAIAGGLILSVLAALAISSLRRW